MDALYFETVYGRKMKRLVIGSDTDTYGTSGSRNDKEDRSRTSADFFCNRSVNTRVWTTFPSLLSLLLGAGCYTAENGFKSSKKFYIPYNIYENLFRLFEGKLVCPF